VEVEEYAMKGVGVRDEGIVFGTYGGIRYSMTLDKETKFYFVIVSKDAFYLL